MSVQLNLEGQKPVPAEIKGWNWGAFFLSWIWGICNGTLIALLSLVPGVHFIMIFVLGAKGNEWAWRNKEWESVEQFHRTQRKWAIWGLSLWLLVFVVLILVPMGLLGWGVSTNMPEIKSMISDFDPKHKYCNYALGAAERNQRCNSLLGTPLAYNGRANFASDEHGYTEMSLPVRGPRGEGTLYLRTHQEANSEVRLERAELELRNLERLKLDTTEVQNKMHATEERIVQLVAAVRARKEWKQREPNGKEEAEEFYREALKRVEEGESIRQLLGTNIGARLENASINEHGPMGEAFFRVNLEGKGQDAVLVLKGVKSLGNWTLAGAELLSQGKQLQCKY